MNPGAFWRDAYVAALKAFQIPVGYNNDADAHHAAEKTANRALEAYEARFDVHGQKRKPDDQET